MPNRSASLQTTFAAPSQRPPWPTGSWTRGDETNAPAHGVADPRPHSPPSRSALLPGRSFHWPGPMKWAAKGPAETF
eukprot:4602511-Pyramimonas_sp.AAC.1